MKQMIFTPCLFEKNFIRKWGEGQFQCKGGHKGWLQKGPGKNEDTCDHIGNFQVKGRGWGSHQGGTFSAGSLNRSKPDPERALSLWNKNQEGNFPRCEEAGTEGCSSRVTITTSAQQSCTTQRRVLFPGPTLQAASFSLSQGPAPH